MRNLILKSHLYLGLLCVPFFLIFGISSLNFNHDFEWMKYEDTDQEKYKKDLVIPIIGDNVKFADAVSDSLNIMGWTLPWTIDQEDSSFFKYSVQHFGSVYQIKILLKENMAEVTRIERGFWSVFNSLHFGGEDVPNAPAIINTWGIYQNLTVGVMLFSIISGIYLWINKKSERTIGTILLLGITGMSFLFMIYIWLVG